MAETGVRQMLPYNRLSVGDIYKVFKAIDNNDIENVRMYIEQGVNVNKTCYLERYRDYMCPLALQCRHGLEDVMEELLKAGADPNQLSGTLLPAMLMAAEQSVLTLSMTSCLISHVADVNLRDDRGMTILHYLARGQFNGRDDSILSAAKLVLENGASFYATDNFAYTPLYEACGSGKVDLVKLFLANGADVHFAIGQMLRGAAEDYNSDIFDFLLNAGADIHLTPDDLISPCKLNNHAMIEKILDTCDVDINMPLNRPAVMTILHFACQHGRTTGETVRVLLDRGADVRALSVTGDTALHYAAMPCNYKKLRQLLSYNSPLNINNNTNQTPLAKRIHGLTDDYQQSRYERQANVWRCVAAFHQAGELAFKMLVTAGAKITADVEESLNQFHIKHPEAQIPDYKIRSTKSLKEMCRFVIRGTIHVPVDVNLCKLPIPKLLQEYLNFPEFGPLVDEYLKSITDAAQNTTTTTATTTTSTISTITSATNTCATSTRDTAITTTTTTTGTAAEDHDDGNEIGGLNKNNDENTAISKTTKQRITKTNCVLC